MAFGRQIKAEQHKRAQAPERVRQPLRAHPLFGTVLALWGAMLGGFVTMALPVDAVLAAAARIGLGELGGMGRFALAGIAAASVGALMLVLAETIRVSRRNPKGTPSIAAKAVRKVRTIDPHTELGSPSLDAPVETMPFSAPEPRFRPEYEAEAETDTEVEAEAEAAPEYVRAHDAPIELDLAEFGMLPGRNAVWVEEQVEDRATPEPAPEFAAPAEEAPALLAAKRQAAPAPIFTEATFEPEAEPAPAPRPAPRPVAAMHRPVPRPLSPSAIERLRAVPTSELSMIQMVERFAAALHERQSPTPGQAAQPIDLAGRDAALAEALKALAALSREGAGENQSEPLRAALSRLQELRGAA
jgi:hypothetical protein